MHRKTEKWKERNVRSAARVGCWLLREQLREFFNMSDLPQIPAPDFVVTLMYAQKNIFSSLEVLSYSQENRRTDLRLPRSPAFPGFPTQSHALFPQGDAI